MKKFISFIKEEDMKAAGDDLDKSFISSALKVSSFSLSASDFTSLKNKKEIQFLFKTYFFPNVDFNTLDRLDVNEFNALINKLKSKHAKEYINMHKYNLKGVGPGEVSMYVLINNAKLGGGSSAGLDIIIGNEEYEIKAVLETTDGYMIDFKLGGTFNMTDIEAKFIELAKKVDPRVTSEIKATLVREIQRKYPAEFNAILELYRARTYDSYFKNHPIIFVKNSSKDMGKIISVKTVKKEEIFIERYTSKTIKPKIKK